MTAPAGVMAAAAEVQTFCHGMAWRFCFIGGIAVQRWGTPRFTQDVDLTLLAGFGDEEKYVDAVLKRFAGRLRDARQFAIDRRVILARTASGIDLDIALGALPFEEASVTRATPWQVGDGIFLNTCSAEDLVIHKVFASRDRDWSDVESVLARQHGRLDLAHIRTELPPLLELKDDVESFAKLQRLIAAVEERLSR